MSESTLVKMSNCWKSHALAQIYYLSYYMLLPDDGMGVLVYNDHCPGEHEPSLMKTCYWSLGPGKTQSCLLSYRV